jgi:hypothetical protein
VRVTCTGEMLSQRSFVGDTHNGVGNSEHAERHAGMAPLPSFGRGNGGTMLC